MTAQQRLEAIGQLVRLIVEQDLGTDRTPRAVPKPQRETLIEHLTGALYVHTEDAIRAKPHPANHAEIPADA